MEDIVFKEGGVVALVGDFAFPHSLDEVLSKKAEGAVRRTLGCLNSKSAKSVLVCPTEGTSLQLLPFLMAMHDVTLVLPTMNYTSTFTPLDQDILDIAIKKAKSVIILNESEAIDPTNYLRLMLETYTYMVEVSDWTLLAHCDKMDYKTERILDYIGDLESPTLRVNLDKEIRFEF